MRAKIAPCPLIGLDSEVVTAGVNISCRIGSFTIAGLPDATITKSRERVGADVQ
jgi:predicted ATPase with chaperone activity